MVKLGVITPVDEPTDWVSSVAYAWKTSSELCIDLDPHDLNNTICGDHHCKPTVDEVAHEFAHSKYFTKLDARYGYWAVILDSKSSLLTTFNTPYSPYCFLCLPFGLAYSQDIFQKRLMLYIPCHHQSTSQRSKSETNMGEVTLLFIIFLISATMVDTLALQEQHI